MKLKVTLAALLLAIPTTTSNAAQFFISNLADAVSDTLWADVSGAASSGDLVTTGYFSAGVTPTDYASLVANIGDFTITNEVLTGTGMDAAGGAASPGYADNSITGLTDIGAVTPPNALLGRPIYSIVTDAANLGSVVNGSGLALIQIGVFLDDTAATNQYNGNPKGFAPIVGTTGSVMIDAGLGAGTQTYDTLQLVVPEPSAALLGLIGFLGLLRRRR